MVTESPSVHLIGPVGPDPGLLNIRRVAQHLGTTERHVRRLVAERALPHFKIGRLLRFSLQDVEAYLAAQRIESRR